MSNLAQTPQLNIPDVIGSPILAKIEHINDLGKSKWYEVVYYDDGWYSYAGSKTFEDGVNCSYVYLVLSLYFSWSQIMNSMVY